MFIKKFTTFINEADVAVDKDLQDRIINMEKVRAEVVKIQNAANSLKGLTKTEDVDTRIEAITVQYENQDDTLISTALSYYKMLAEKQKLAIRQKQFETEIPEMATKLETDLNNLVQQITDLRKTATA
jgi:predicted O-linked N-acetylglucosamine transferase (SPINDLY family)